MMIKMIRKKKKKKTCAYFRITRLIEQSRKRESLSLLKVKRSNGLATCVLFVSIRGEADNPHVIYLLHLLFCGGINNQIQGALWRRGLASLSAAWGDLYIFLQVIIPMVFSRLPFLFIVTRKTSTQQQQQHL
jgi:hypothetical protein